MLLVWFAVGLVAWRILRRREVSFLSAPQLFSLVPAILLILGVVQLTQGILARVEISKKIRSRDITTALINQDPVLDFPDVLPDIYYIVLDAYSRKDKLQVICGHDNSEFELYLRSKGFYICQKSNSNYGSWPGTFIMLVKAPAADSVQLSSLSVLLRTMSSAP